MRDCASSRSPADIAGPYCTKLLVDLGAEVTKIEPPSGDPLRRWGPFPGGVPDPNRSGLFEYLNAGKRGATLDLESDASAAGRLIAQAHLLVDGMRPGTLDRVGLDVHALEALNPDLVVVRISDFGQNGPLRDRVATPLTMQAASGWINRRDPDRPPVQAGARISEYVAGSYAALGALTALRTQSVDGPVEVDVSVLESLLSTLPYPMLMAEKMRNLGLPANTRSAPMMGIVRAADGWLGINCLTGQHWLDVCAMLGLPEYGEHQIAIMLGGPERAEFFEKAQPWLSERTVAEIVELSQAMRIPASPVSDGATALECPQYLDRGFFVEAGGDDWAFRRPGAPFRLSKTPVLPPRPAPRLGASADTVATKADSPGPLSADADPAMPFADVKVLDLTTFWAGAYLTCYLGAFGAEIVKVESIQRPDGHRYSGAWAYEGDRWYERSAMWQGTNLNKRDITLDLTSDRGARPRAPTRSRCRRRRGELLASGDRAVRAGLRIPDRAQTRRDLRAHARVRPAGAVARLCRLGAQLRADIGHGGRHRLRRRPAVQPAGARRSDRRGARRASRCSPRSSIGAAPAKANSSRSLRSRSRRASPPSR